MVIPAKVQHAVQYQLLYLKLQRQPVLIRLLRGLLGGDNDIAQKMLFVRFKFVSLVRERKHVGRRVLSSKKRIELFHPTIRNERDRKRPARRFFHAGQHSRSEWPERRRLDLNFSLEIYYHNGYLVLISSLGVMRVVCLHDHLHQFVADDVFFGEVNELDAIEVC